MADDPQPTWAVPPGLPTRHTATAALRAASGLDQRGSRVVDMEESYWHMATGGLLPPHDLWVGEQLLVDVGLVERIDDRLFPTAQLDALLDGTVEVALTAIYLRAVDRLMMRDNGPTEMNEIQAAVEVFTADRAVREHIHQACLKKFDDTHQRLIGEIGEEIVVRAARQELVQIGRTDLARGVRQVSLEADGFGYDVSAPRLSGSPRLLEVKATAAAVGDRVRFYISRNEATVGQKRPEWSLVICQVGDIENRTGEVLGWLAGWQLETALPNDAPTGRWESAQVDLAVADLHFGLPSCTT